MLPIPREQAHALLDLILDLAERGSTRSAVGPVTYSQRDGERPSGCGRAKFLRVHRRARLSGDPGATTEGRARLMTADAWARHHDAVPSRRRVAPVVAPVAMNVAERVRLDLVRGRRSA
jgi:hypothetical protein